MSDRGTQDNNQQLYSTASSQLCLTALSLCLTAPLPLLDSPLPMLPGPDQLLLRAGSGEPVHGHPGWQERRQERAGQVQPG